MTKRFPMTSKGHTKLVDELHDLKMIQRPEVISAIAEARSHGDLSENAEYSAAKEKQRFLEARIADLEDKLSRAEVIDTSDLQSDKIQFGAKVELMDCDSEEEKIIAYKIVGDYEANLQNYEISTLSPLAQSLMGKGAGDEIEVTTPRGMRYYRVISVSYTDDD